MTFCGLFVDLLWIQVAWFTSLFSEDVTFFVEHEYDISMITNDETNKTICLFIK